MSRVFGPLLAVLVLGLSAILPNVAMAQTAAEAAAARELDYGKDIFKTKATCQFCHKWDGSGDQGYGGNALPLRTTILTKEQVIETVKCGRVGTGMPYHDKFAYGDKRCFGATREELGSDTPPTANEFLQPREIEAVVNYVFAKMVGRGAATYEECLDFWGKDTRQCEPLKK